MTPAEICEKYLFSRIVLTVMCNILHLGHFYKDSGLIFTANAVLKVR